MALPCICRMQHQDRRPIGAIIRLHQIGDITEITGGRHICIRLTPPASNRRIAG